MLVANVEKGPVLHVRCRDDGTFDAADRAEVPIRRVARRFMGQTDNVS